MYYDVSMFCTTLARVTVYSLNITKSSKYSVTNEIYEDYMR